DTDWLAQDERMLARHHGQLLWRARLNPLVAAPEQRFDEILIYGFSDIQHRDAWAGDDERETLQTLQRRLFKRDVLILAEAVPIVAPPPPAEPVAADAKAVTAAGTTNDAAPVEAPTSDATRIDANGATAVDASDAAGAQNPGSGP